MIADCFVNDPFMVEDKDVIITVGVTLTFDSKIVGSNSAFHSIRKKYIYALDCPITPSIIVWG